jgi:Flp pilus assembly protein TadG
MQMSLPTRLSRGSRLRPVRKNDRGFVLALNALCLTVLMAVGGFAVDLGSWYLSASRLQRAADAAALAGSVYLPNDFAAAKRAAEENLANHAAQTKVVSITQSAAQPTMLRVSLEETVQNSFVSLLGHKSQRIARTATGEYRPYVPMGSPSNVLGVEPDIRTFPQWEKDTIVGKQSSYWLNIVGGNTPKGNGDRYSGGSCSGGADRCDSSAPIPTGNQDYSPDGQAYVVRIPDGVTGNLEIQAFDPVFAYVNDYCTQNTLDGANDYSPPGTNLYRKGNSEPACTGDQSTDTSKPAPDTTFQLYTPEGTNGGSRPVSTGTCSAKTYEGYKGRIVDKVRPGSSRYDPDFVAAFRKWTPVCKLSIGAGYPPGDYVLRVSTTLNSNGLNRFALRTAIMSSPTTVDDSRTSQLSMFSKGRLVVYAHDNSSDVMFYLARIHSGAAGHDLTLTLFDIGDAAGGASLSVVPPDEATNNGSPLENFTGCMYTRPGSSTLQPTGTGCGITGMSSGSYNGKIVSIRIPVPAEYRCNDSSSEGCWVRMRLNYGAGSVQDTTSWEVSLNGQPLHLVPN